MKCPVCHSVDLNITERSGIEVDYCPSCRGIWLDRGELDKIIERASAYSTQFRDDGSPRKRKRDEFVVTDYNDYDDRYEEQRVPKQRKDRKRDFFDDLFDIFD